MRSCPRRPAGRPALGCNPARPAASRWRPRGSLRGAEPVPASPGLAQRSSPPGLRRPDHPGPDHRHRHPVERVHHRRHDEPVRSDRRRRRARQRRRGRLHPGRCPALGVRPGPVDREGSLLTGVNGHFPEAESTASGPRWPNDPRVAASCRSCSNRRPSRATARSSPPRSTCSASRPRMPCRLETIAGQTIAVDRPRRRRGFSQHGGRDRARRRAGQQRPALRPAPPRRTRSTPCAPVTRLGRPRRRSGHDLPAAGRLQDAAACGRSRSTRC